MSTTISTLFASLSGCVSSISPSNQSILSCIEIANADTQSHTVHVRVDHEGEEILSDSYIIKSRKESGSLQHQWIKQDWPDKPGYFRIHMRMDRDSEWSTVDSGEMSDKYAFQVAYWIGGDGSGIPFWETIAFEDYEGEYQGSIVVPSEVSS
jgi:hypothetical protein